MNERNRQRSLSRNQSRRGSVVVETTIVLSLLLTGLLGIFEYGRLVMIRQLMNNAAREGARMAVVTTASQPTTVTQQITDAVNNYLAGQAIQNVVIQIYQADPTTGANVGPWNLTPYGGSIAVQIDGDYVPVIPTSAGILPSQIHFTSLSMMLSEAN
jgi:Flp pilus assembly protein TadG